MFSDRYFALQVRSTKISVTKFHLKNHVILTLIFHEPVLENMELSGNLILQNEWAPCFNLQYLESKVQG